MSDITLPALYAISLVQVLLLGMACFYSIRIYRTVGSFASWTLIMSAFVLIVVNDLFSFLSLVTLPAASFDSLISTNSGIMAFLPNIFTLGSSMGLAAGMRGLSKVFKPKAKVPAQVAPIPLTQ